MMQADLVTWMSVSLYDEGWAVGAQFYARMQPILHAAFHNML